ncbi:MAG: hydrogenase formation protein HypD [Acidobacteriota bacterium]
MKHIDEYRDEKVISGMASTISRRKAAKPLKFMHVCGTHENAIARFGLRALLPEWIRIIAGPGCPVCICPTEDIDLASQIALEKKAAIVTFGDMMKVPATDGSLFDVKSSGGKIHVVYSPSDAVSMARENPYEEICFFGVGFETTAAPVAAAILSRPPDNFSMISSHRIIPPALELLLNRDDVAIDGFILPGHVTTVMGYSEYEDFPKKYGKGVAIAGFEPADVLLAILNLVEQVIEKDYKVFNCYRRSVTREGNRLAREAIQNVFEISDSRWRGIGIIKNSGLKLRTEFQKYDAVKKFQLRKEKESIDLNPGCLCHLIMIGKIEPPECPMFGKRCTPEFPYGPCMVSSEGTCRLHHGL